MRHRRCAHPVRRVSIVLFLLAAVLLLCLWRSNRCLQTTRFELAFPDLPEGFDGTRITVLADSHGTRFGDRNETLFAAVAKTEPDYIFFPGDLEDSTRGPEPGYPEEMAAGLSAIAPTFYVTGNHEWANGHVPQLKKRLREQGVTVLSNQFVPLEKNGDTILLAGIDDPNGRIDQKTPQTLATELYTAWGDPFWILLAHRNDRFEEQYSLLGADLVVTGHGHGGIIRLPFTDGLLGHGEFFPHNTSGICEANGSTMFVTRGIGNNRRSLRLFNRPEIAVLTLHRAD